MGENVLEIIQGQQLTGKQIKEHFHLTLFEYFATLSYFII